MSNKDNIRVRIIVVTKSESDTFDEIKHFDYHSDFREYIGSILQQNITIIIQSL